MKPSPTEIFSIEECVTDFFSYVYPETDKEEELIDRSKTFVFFIRLPPLWLSKR